MSVNLDGLAILFGRRSALLLKEEEPKPLGLKDMDIGKNPSTCPLGV